MYLISTMSTQWSRCERNSMDFHLNSNWNPIMSNQWRHFSSKHVRLRWAFSFQQIRGLQRIFLFTHFSICNYSNIIHAQHISNQNFHFLSFQVSVFNFSIEFSFLYALIIIYWIWVFNYNWVNILWEHTIPYQIIFPSNFTAKGSKTENKF